MTGRAVRRRRLLVHQFRCGLFRGSGYWRTTAAEGSATGARALHRIGWIGLTVVGGLLLFAVAADLAGDRRDGIPADHADVFAAMVGIPSRSSRH